MLAQIGSLLAIGLRLCVYASVCDTPIIVSKRQLRMSWFLAYKLSATYPTLF